MTWNERYPTYCSMIETTLPQYLPSVELPQGKVSEAMAYSLLGGGKRIRGCLTLAMCGSCSATGLCRRDDSCLFAHPR